jgi:hypothetical protein
MWQDDDKAKSIKLSWSKAKKYCKDSDYMGFDDWYLPNVYELEGIVDFNKHNPAIKDGFKNVVSKRYWSSSVSRMFSTNAWAVDFKYAGIGNYNSAETVKFYLRCVRKIKFDGE